MLFHAGQAFFDLGQQGAGLRVAAAAVDGHAVAAEELADVVVEDQFGAFFAGVDDAGGEAAAGHARRRFRIQAAAKAYFDQLAHVDALHCRSNICQHAFNATQRAELRVSFVHQVVEVCFEARRRSGSAARR